MDKTDYSSKKRILMALNNKKPDKVPIYELHIDAPIIIKLAELLLSESETEKIDINNEEDKKILDLYCSIIDRLSIDSTSSSFSMGMEDVSEVHGRDKYGVLYSYSSHGAPLPIDGPVKDKSDVNNLNMIQKLIIDDFQDSIHIIKKLGSGRAHFLMVPDPFKLCWYLMGGMQNLLINYMTNIKLIHDLTKKVTEFDVSVIEIAKKIGIDVIVLNGDLAGESNMIISPEQFREFIKPYHRIIVEKAHKLGLKIVKHSDGNIWPILDDFIEVGFDGIHPIQPQSMDIIEVKKHLGGKACIIGNIDCRNLLTDGSESEVDMVVKDTIEKVGKDGGYIISSSNSIHPGVEPKNYIAMVKAAHKYGVYDNKK